MAWLDTIEIITFDCYGTLIDWESGLRATLARLADERGLTFPVADLLVRWETIQFALLEGPYQSYRTILRQSVSATFAEQGVALTSAQADCLADELPGWAPFADVRPALARLSRRYRLAILSNMDNDLLRASVRQLGVTFDALISAEDVRSYKPRAAHFDEALRRFGRPPETFLHAAFGFKYDQRPALALGMRTAWIKRPGWIRDDVASPTVEVDSLAALAEMLGRDSTTGSRKGRWG